MWVLSAKHQCERLSLHSYVITELKEEKTEAAGFMFLSVQQT